ncbi:hypothetical protein PGTUg99_024664 [Puccinia graminis f. sp. tritici]|uniref:Uncharacterized protein n=1 Tax=Puccinia graminis f. sp. tritici TaxID=56615 RepID=A0A5B0MSU9_PUCGR|nr:hypothetical protein PGTUg99_024664 [Puccinia graminis f. sp. tritici]
MRSSCSGGVSSNRLLSYGTPFYGLYYQKAETELSPVTAISQIMMIARAKLLYHDPSSGLSQSQIFALLGSTIQPQMYTAWEINTETLSSHAAHCMYISPSQDKIVCDYPSHLLYSSAAHQFLASDDSHWVTCIDALTLAVQQGLITIGDAREMAAKIILVRAIHQTMKKLLEGEDEIVSQEAECDQEDSISPRVSNNSIPYGHPV